ncbi:saccharopine dehydrogenase NADP-binding domain-containing protein [Nocardia terpenica]|uniref:saccharopine dehydrogenase NADP-binding domain-containing protein n=1 Tax=Nocardia terpenica TaxID=455432 RepID=UPI0015C53DFA|nr:saccharopine dehydrogenase NADP-binding domain-containing protein [Nocardia terpenica]MBF6059756.1 saccharopine dehydrogenase NADP-binding domain-containing protein [Nocardia terpenica]MBF6102703.1 saccharopine dehydrogenase NADP-binding domain-containing protein [Nocardia terpenica]MBF6111106.1 saccharopine dehydrogenase NADP-binding domain-containing protein [Nocardia terpenica]MBF6117237.1 saccharopine dehydrogenase NADP-binding domain-containing protein [Nocardia terpenica]MBF6150922.1 
MQVVVYGASGHTGRFIIRELRERGWDVVVSGRDADRLAALDGEARPAAADDPAALDRALAGAAAVVNAAGPFARTAHPLIEAALRAGIHYVDVAAEVEVADEVTRRYQERAQAAGVTIAPSVAFYGGLGDLLASAALGDLPAADEIHLAYALTSWKPTMGTRRTSDTSRGRREGKRLVYDGRKLVLRTDSEPISRWDFPEPFGTQEVVGEFTTADSVTIPHHLKTAALHTYMTTAPLADLSDPDLSPPPAVDDRGRSAQRFLVEVVVRSGATERRARAGGQDIYAVTAPIVAAALHRIVTTPTTGVLTAGQIPTPRALLTDLHPSHLEQLELPD